MVGFLSLEGEEKKKKKKTLLAGALIRARLASSVDGEGRRQAEERKDEGEGEAKLRYETMENLAKGGSVPLFSSLSVVSVQSVGGLLRLRPFFPSSSSPTLSLPFLSRAEKEGEGSAPTRLTDEPF